ncbi:MAG: hypothetical protein GX820_03855 [Bacteroidales bacterium]|nr:hypothetical protein [Bacteroidales bacterium]
MSNISKLTLRSNVLSVARARTRVVLVKNDMVNVLQEAPVKDTPYIINSLKYGRPSFRLKRRGGYGFPESDAFWFTKDDTSGKVKLNCIVEVFRAEADVQPMMIKNTSLILEYNSGAEKVVKTLKITQSPSVNQTNILQDIYAELDINDKELKQLTEALTDPGKAPVLKIKSELWWKKPESTVPQKDSEAAVKPASSASRDRLKMVSRAAAARSKSAVSRAAAARSRSVASLVTEAAVVPADDKPQKLDLEHLIVLHYGKDDSAVFGDITEQYEVLDFKWKHESIIKDEMYTIYYRPTARPDTFYFLPQVFRIKVNEYSGEPKISIAMIPGENPELIEQFRIIISIQIVPYYNPKAKKDLFRTLNNISGGKIKYCNLSLGGYNSASFSLKPEYSGENVVFRGKISEKIQSIDPVNGFTLSVDCTLESFDFFKRELINGFIIGDIIFDLIEETKDGENVTSSPPIPVELDISKLGGIKVGMEIIDNDEEEVTFPKGVKLFNENEFPITIKGTELILLSEIGNTIYDADYDIGNSASWPLILPEKSSGSQDVLLRQSDINNISEENRYWTKLICEPHGVSLNTDSQSTIERIIDYASGDPQIWELRVGCPLFERWDDLDDSLLQPYKLLDKIEVEIKSESGKTLGIVLAKNSPFQIIQMARSISDILKTQQINSRQYQYRVRSHYILSKTDWTEWKDPDSTAANFLDVQPQLLTN